MRAWRWGIVACMLHVSAARASGVATPKDSFARLAGERALVVWDPAAKREHLVIKSWFEGDARTVGWLIPTPSAPTVAVAEDALLDRAASLVEGEASPVLEAPGGGADVIARVRLVAAPAESFPARELGAWLERAGLVRDPSLLAWAAAYPASWSFTLVRLTPGSDAARRVVEAPAVRFSFAATAPFYPYSEPPGDASKEAVFYKRYGTGCVAGDPLCASKEGRFLTRPLDLVTLAPRQLGATRAETTGGPVPSLSVLAPTVTLQRALGPTETWPFDATSADLWALTRGSERRLDRRGPVDLSFASFELPPPRALDGLDPEALRAWSGEADPSPPPSARSAPAPRRGRVALGTLATVALVLAVALALALERQKPGDRP